MQKIEFIIIFLLTTALTTKAQQVTLSTLLHAYNSGSIHDAYKCLASINKFKGHITNDSLHNLRKQAGGDSNGIPFGTNSLQQYLANGLFKPSIVVP